MTNDILNIFEISADDIRERWLFTPMVEGYTSYTVDYSECSNKADACIAVWESINAGTKINRKQHIKHLNQ